MRISMLMISIVTRVRELTTKLQSSIILIDDQCFTVNDTIIETLLDTINEDNTWDHSNDEIIIISIIIIYDLNQIPSPINAQFSLSKMKK
jgi:hypothetical protein